jgi:two-component system, NarL family, nitrate/nitrite response regulator NarL
MEGITSFAPANLRNLNLRGRLSAGMIRYRIGFLDMAPFSQGFSPDHQKAIGVTILDAASPNTNKGHNIMGHDVVYKEQILPIAQDPFENVTTVLICQNVLLRAGLRHILSGTRFTPADDVSEDMKGLRAFADKVPVLVVICDTWTPEDYAASIQELKAHCPSARVVLLTDTIDPETVPQLCRSGVDGFCPTNMERPTLVKAFEMVMLGETFIPASIGLALLDQVRRAPAGGLASAAAIPATDTLRLLNKLSEREAQILRCLTLGSSNKVIARELGVAEATVKVHIKAILRKVKASNRTQAAMWAAGHFSAAQNGEAQAPGE